jgi:DNA-binding MarR family transcriptional regulator
MRHHPATISSLLNRLERAGLVERRASPADGRRSVVIATERGRELGARSGSTIEAVVGAVILASDPSAVAACAHLLSTLTEALEPLAEDEVE